MHTATEQSIRTLNLSGGYVLVFLFIQNTAIRNQSHIRMRNHKNLQTTPNSKSSARKIVYILKPYSDLLCTDNPPSHPTYTHTHTHAHTRTHARTHARTHTRTHARTLLFTSALTIYFSRHSTFHVSTDNLLFTSALTIYFSYLSLPQK